MSFNNLPSGVETILLRPSGETQIYNSAGVLVPESENTGQIVLFDQLPPDGDADAEDGAVNVNQGDSLSMTFTDYLYNPQTGELATLSELAEFVILRSGNSSGIDIPFYTDWVENPPNPPTLIIVPQDDYESEQDIYFSFNAVLADANGNTVEFSFEASFSIRDYVPPVVIGGELAPNNSYLDIEFDDQIFGDSTANTAIGIENFQIEYPDIWFEDNIVTITSLTRTDSNLLIGGESNIRFNFQYNFTPSGIEYPLNIVIQEGAEIYDESGNQIVGQNVTFDLFDIPLLLFCARHRSPKNSGSRLLLLRKKFLALVLDAIRHESLPYSALRSVLVAIPGGYKCCMGLAL